MYSDLDYNNDNVTHIVAIQGFFEVCKNCERFSGNQKTEQYRNHNDIYICYDYCYEAKKEAEKISKDDL